MPYKTGMSNLDKKTEPPMVRQEDAAILREAIAGVMKNAPRAIQHQCNTALSFYASRVKEYCSHPERSFVAQEQKFACLDCGHRSDA